MSLNYKQMQNLITAKRFKVSDVTCHIGMTYQGFRAGLNSGKIGSDKVLSLCQLLKISPNDFYEWSKVEPMVLDSVGEDPRAANKLLREQIDAKDKQIETLINLTDKLIKKQEDSK